MRPPNVVINALAGGFEIQLVRFGCSSLEFFEMGRIRGLTGQVNVLVLLYLREDEADRLGDYLGYWARSSSVSR